MFLPLGGVLSPGSLDPVDDDCGEAIGDGGHNEGS